MAARPSLRAVAALTIAVGAPIATAGISTAQTSEPPETVSPSPGAHVGRTEDQVVLSGSVSVARGRSVGEVVVFHGRASVGGVVVGDVVVLDGPIVVSGQVSGNVIAVNGPIKLGATASVGGDVLGAEGVTLEPGALVGGQVNDDVAFTPRGTLAALDAVLGAITIAVSTLIVLLAFVLAAPRAVDRVALAGRTAPFASTGSGVLIAVVLPFVAIAAAASILALPLGVSLLLAAGAIALAGYAFTAFTIGRAILPEPRSGVGAAFAGWGIAAVVGLVPFLNVAAWALGSMFGLGAASVAVLRARTLNPSRGKHRAGSRPRSAPIGPERASSVPAGE